MVSVCPDVSGQWSDDVGRRYYPVHGDVMGSRPVQHQCPAAGRCDM